MPRKFAAIPTIYRGIQMRSRLEAKWAHVFDSLKWRWEYEPIDLNGWIPDFVVRLPVLRKPMLVEIKPVFHYSEDRATIIKIEQALGAPKPAELRAKGDNGNDKSWDTFFDGLQYEALFLGAALNGEFIGWRFDRYWGWGGGTEHLCTASDLAAAWKTATNSAQWKPQR